MNKNEFIEALYSRLGDIPRENTAVSVDYYCEMIDDRIEDGLTEDEAVAALGSIDDIATQICAEQPVQTEVPVKTKSPMKVWQIVLIALGFPLWFSLLAAALAIVFAVYIVIWSVVIAFYAVSISLIVSGLACLVSAGALYIAMQPGQGTFTFGAGLIILSLGVLLVFPCNLLVKYTAIFTVKMTKRIVSFFKGKGKA